MDLSITSETDLTAFLGISVSLQSPKTTFGRWTDGKAYDVTILDIQPHEMRCAISAAQTLAMDEGDYDLVIKTSEKISCVIPNFVTMKTHSLSERYVTEEEI